MFPISFVEITVLIVFAVNAVLVAVLVVLKAVHRRRVRLHDARREEYVHLLSRHLAFDHCTDPITPKMAVDPAFLDALIDVRSVVTGSELTRLLDIAKRHAVITQQVRRLEAPFLVGRRLRAAVALAEIGDETSAEALMEHLADREPEIRIQCARGLARIQWTPAIDRIVARFSVEIPRVRVRLSDALIEFGPKATWPLLAYVRINHRFEQAGPALALRTLAMIGDPEAARPLLEILAETEDLEIAIPTIEALGGIGSPVAAPALRELANSPHWELRAKSASALGKVGDPGSRPLLMRALRDSSWWVRRSAAAALAELPGGIETLYLALDDSDPYAADAAAEALTDAGELVSARKRIETGDTSEERLLAHMGGGR
ncbi:MAG: HEAT repeat domain-containing protein [Acidimicrobiia bacterium]|jgi:HEAT repeat protein